MNVWGEDQPAASQTSRRATPEISCLYQELQFPRGQNSTRGTSLSRFMDLYVVVQSERRPEMYYLYIY